MAQKERKIKVAEVRPFSLLKMTMKKNVAKEKRKERLEPLLFIRNSYRFVFVLLNFNLYRLFHAADISKQFFAGIGR